MYGVVGIGNGAMIDKPMRPSENSTPLDCGAARYVWDAEGVMPSTGEVGVTIGDLRLTLDLRFAHERRYALGYLFGLRNPQADIDRLLFRAFVRPGDAILDAGANIGVTAAEALACGADHVICIEPEASLVERLHLLRSLSSDRISVWHCALGAEEGVAQLLLSQEHNQGHTISPKMVSLFPDLFGRQSQSIQVSTIDTILQDKPCALWKLDVEGFEPEAVTGARRRLERCPPRTILAELYDPFVSKVVDLLSDYRVRRAALAQADYALKFLDQVGGDLPEEFCPMSPTYVFTLD